MTFLEFCKKTASDGILPAIDVDECPERYANGADIVIANNKNKRDVFDQIKIPHYIEAVFNNDVSAILEEKLTDGEIPNGLLSKLTKGIFSKKTEELNEDQAAIIKTLAAYICIQN